MIVTGALEVRYLGNGDWGLISPLRVTWKVRPAFHVVKGFKTDLASIPRIVRSLVPKGRNETRAAVVHDWIYRGRCEQRFTRAEADRLFLDIMEEDGVGWLRRWAIYSGVRAGGWASWKGREKGKDSDTDEHG